jgi:hypothetical protein
MVKMLQSLVQNPCSTSRYQTFFKKLNPDGTHGTSDTQIIGSHRLDGDEEGSHRYAWHVSRRVPQVGCRRTKRRLLWRIASVEWHASCRDPQVGWRWAIRSHRYTWHVSHWVPQFGQHLPTSIKFLLLNYSNIFFSFSQDLNSNSTLTLSQTSTYSNFTQME